MRWQPTRELYSRYENGDLAARRAVRAFNRSRIATVVVVPLTRNLRLAEAPGYVLLARRDTGLPSDSVANVSQVITLDRELLTELIGQLPARPLSLVLAGIDLVLGR